MRCLRAEEATGCAELKSSGERDSLSVRWDSGGYNRQRLQPMG